ncbi:lyase family protein [Streptomyces sp. NPDC052101]|uniref:lyase family protein n=1 Tax=Streptomyces sp. NPDC052101 TaxID=3155763 RepID=UPI00343D7AD3
MKSPAADRDTGLLSPLRAGTPVERAVSDQAWLQAMLDAEAALARAQARLGTVPEKAAALITAAARAESVNARDIAVRARGTADPVAELIGAFTRVVAKLDADAAPYVHRGATSQDILDTAALLVCGRALRLVRGDLQRVLTALPARAVPGRRAWAVDGQRSVAEADGRLAGLLDDGLPAVLHGPDRALATVFAEEAGLAAAGPAGPTAPAPLVEVGQALTGTVQALDELVTGVRTVPAGTFGHPGPGELPSAVAEFHERTRGPAELVRGAALQVPALCTILELCRPARREQPPAARHAVWQPLREILRLTGGAAHTAARLTEDLDTALRAASRMRLSPF